MALEKKPDHMNHKQWRAYLKKMKRKKKRTDLAKEREATQPALEENVTDSETERQREEEEEEQSLRQNLLWMQREREAQAAFKAKKDWEEKEKLRKEETERKIKEEWAERERKEREEQEEKEKKEAEKKEKQPVLAASILTYVTGSLVELLESNMWRIKKLLQEATANENKEPWHNPIGPVQYSQEKKVEHCPFFKKTATCRFGEECSRFHDYPESSTTILIPRMFSSIELEQSSVDALDADMSLEFEEGDLYQSFRNFYLDVVPEFKTVGPVIQVKVCCNYEPHLKGNVYVQYRSESSAHKAYEKFNARWYGGRQLTCIFVNIESWKSAICGLAFRKRCPKGKHCNFLHVFLNPGGEFADMDHDNPVSERRDHGSRRGHLLENGRSRRHGSYQDDDYRRDRRSESVRSSRSSRRRSRSQDRRGSYRDRSRSRSPSKSHSTRSMRHSKSRSSVYQNRSRSRSSERSSRSKRRSRSRSKQRTAVKRHSSKSPTKEKHLKHHKSSSSSKKSHTHKSMSKSPDHHNRRSKSRLKDKISNGVNLQSSEKNNASPQTQRPTTKQSSSSSSSSQSTDSSTSSDSESESPDIHKPNRLEPEKSDRLKDILPTRDVNHEELHSTESITTVSSVLSPSHGKETSSLQTAGEAAREKSTGKRKKTKKTKKRHKSSESESDEEYVYVEKTIDSL